MYRIYLVEDDETITGALKRQLEHWDYLVRTAEDFGQVAAEYQAFDPHLTLIDISLPFYNGYYWCGEIRKFSKAPIIFISSASDDMNQVMALSMGADDFIAKPFHMEVLTAKVQALLRRSYAFIGDPNILSCGAVTLDLKAAALRYGEELLALSRNELRILELLFERQGEAVSREDLMGRLWETENFIDDNTLTVNVTRLRRKLEGLGLDGFIRTKKGLGYQIGGEA